MSPHQFSRSLSTAAQKIHPWLPTRGNVIFTLLVVTLLFWAQSVGAFPAATPTGTSTGTIAYQGRLADAAGTPLTSTYPIIFRLYSSASGGVPLWEEQWTGPNSVQVSDGLFNVMLGSLTPIPQNTITGNGSLWLGITIGTDDEMMPRVQLGTVPYAVQALTVPDSSVTSAKIADGAVSTADLANGAVTQAKLGADVSLVPPDGSINTQKLADNAVTSAKIADGSVSNADLADGSVTQAEAPTLLKDGTGTNDIVQWGNVVVNNTGSVRINFTSCFPNAARVFIPVNGHYAANVAYVKAHTGLDNCGATVILSEANNLSIRINWIAIGY